LAADEKAAKDAQQAAAARASHAAGKKPKK